MIIIFGNLNILRVIYNNIEIGSNLKMNSFYFTFILKTKGQKQNYFKKVK